MEQLNIEERIENGLVPKQLENENFRFAKIPKFEVIDGKKNLNQESGKTPYKLSELQNWISSGNNVGIWGWHGKLGVVDLDHPDRDTRHAMLKAIITQCGKTWIVKSCSEKEHLYYYIDCECHPIMKIRGDKDNKTAWEIRAKRDKFTLVPINNHGLYRTFYDHDIATTTIEQILCALKPWTWENEEHLNNINDDQIQEGNKSNKININEILTFDNFLSHYGMTIKTFVCPKCQNISSEGKVKPALEYYDDHISCFRCGGGKKAKRWDMWSMLEHAGCVDKKEQLKTLYEIAGLEWKEYKKDDDVGVIDESEVEYDDVCEIDEDEESKTTIYRSIAKQFHSKQPFYYDSNKLWWMWDMNRWKNIDETDLFIAFDKYFVKATERSQIKSSYLEAFRKIGRLNAPIEPPTTWIQFQEEIIDYKTEEILKPSPKYFMTNVIPHNLSLDRICLDTPTIDKYLNEWVGDQAMTLNEFCAHAMCNEYIVQQLVAFIGGGSNGKSTFINFMIKLLGKVNHGSTSFERLKGRFETYYKMYKKLLCTISEINHTVFNQTELLKAMTGDDSMAFEKKNAGCGDFTNYSKVVIACNKLPETTDKSDGFFRRWLIVDFPNQFDEKTKNIVESIPEYEIENFCTKAVLWYLPTLLERGNYYGDGGIQDRKQRYNDRSGNIRPFLGDYCHITGDSEDYILIEDLREKYKEYLLSISQSIPSDAMIGRQMALIGYKSVVKTIYGQSSRVYCGLKWLEGIR